MNKVSKPLVSVCVQTYQHFSYVRECLDGILMQKTDFQYEIILGEDESNDGTREICIEYAEKYPEIIRLFLRSRKDVIFINGLATGRNNFIQNLKAARGEYIALCEGDDYWTDPYKLQKQVDILERHSDCIACHHWHKHLYEGINCQKKLEPAPKHGAGYYPQKISTVREIFANRLRIKTRTVMYRNILKKIPLPDWLWKTAFGDVPLSMFMGKFGDFYFIDEEMAVYRITNKGASTAGKELLSPEEWMAEHYKKWITIWDYGNNEYNFKYNTEAQRTINLFNQKICSLYYVIDRRWLRLIIFNVNRHTNLINKMHTICLMPKFLLISSISKVWKVLQSRRIS